jgi:hypothetical protein
MNRNRALQPDDLALTIPQLLLDAFPVPPHRAFQNERRQRGRIFHTDAS